MFGLSAWTIFPLPQQAQQVPDPQQIEPIKTSITVSERISTETPASLTVLEQRDIEATPGVNIDDRLRTVPGFSLFRRSSSLVANPTTQGVSLRGLGSSGASRTLLLWDGIPENDPFGGWVYWDRFAPLELQRVEVSRGAATSVFGDRAMGGAIGFFSATPERVHGQVYYDGGSQSSQELGAGVSGSLRHFGASGNVRFFTTDGYFIVPSGVRGRIDTPATVDFAAGNLRLDFFNSVQRLFLKLDGLAEHRENGTALQRNATGLGSLAANYSYQWKTDQLSVLAFHTRDDYRATFSSIAADRSTERLTFQQTVPAEGTGAAAFWRHGFSTANTILGADVQRVEGYSTDRLVPTGVRIGGGSQLQHGVFGQLDFKTGPVQFFLGARHQFTGTAGDTFFSPSFGAAAGRGRFRGRGSVYRSFRAPTLNELYRQFRVGNVITLANAQLRPETLFGAEAGLDFVGESSRISVTAFRSSLHNLISNITLASAPGTITRQRQNAVEALSRGFEMNARRNWHGWFGELSYLFAEGRYLTGERIPQVPKHQGSATLGFERRNTLITGVVRSSGLQFEDDRNQMLLPGFATIGVSAQQRLRAGLFGTAEVENLLDRQYLAGFTPTPTIGAPRLFRIGLRWMK